MTEQKEIQANWLLKIRSRVDAIKIARDCSLAFFFIAGLQAIFAYWVGLSGLVDAAIFVLCGYFIRRSFSRVAAVITLLLSSFSLVGTVLNKLGMAVGGGNNIILALIIMCASIKAVEATFKLHGRYREEAHSEIQDTKTT